MDLQSFHLFLSNELDQLFDVVKLKTLCFGEDLVLSVSVDHVWRKPTPVIERIDLLVFNEVVDVWKAFDRGDSHRPVIQVIEKTDSIFVGTTSNQIFHIFVVGFLLKLKSFAVIHVLVEFDWAVFTELVVSYLSLLLFDHSHSSLA